MAEIRIIHPNERETESASGGMTRAAGVSMALVGAEGIHMAIATIPPGHRSSPHVHTNCESALYVLSGHGRFLIGDDLSEALDFGPGDCLYVPPGAPHAPVNDGDEHIELVVVRNALVEIVEEYAVGSVKKEA